MKIKKVAFLPNQIIDLSGTEKSIAIKGNTPRLNYSFSMVEIYESVKSLTVLHSYQFIRKELYQVNLILSKKLKIRADILLPEAADEKEAVLYESSIFDACKAFNAEKIDIIQGKFNSIISNGNTFFLPLPFRLSEASDERNLHTLYWIDCNMKLQIEKALISFSIPKEFIEEVVLSAFKIYSSLLKQNDYSLIRVINLNYSMFLQDRIIELLLGNILVKERDITISSSFESNNRALQYLKTVNVRSVEKLSELSVFFGTVWLKNSQNSDSFGTENNLLYNIENQLKISERRWGVNDFSILQNRISNLTAPANVMVVLDDNGESVFDIAIFQRFLLEYPLLNVTFLTNRYPVSNNIFYGAFEKLLDDDYFLPMRQFIEDKRVTVSIEEQPFRSFEVDFLSKHTKEILKKTAFLYVKGVNFFETFQLPEIERFHCFVVYGLTSTMFTGFQEGDGIFAHIPKNEVAYKYHSAQNIETLKSIKEKRKSYNGK